MRSLCFTGHRPNKLGGYTEPNLTATRIQGELARVIREQHAEGFRTFISGMAQGVDMWAAEAVIALKPECPGMRLLAAVPFVEQPLVWKPEGWRRWARILKQCDEVWLTDYDKTLTVEQLSETLLPLWGKTSHVNDFARKLNLRNEWMVQRSGRVIAVWDGSAGGTGNCVRYAERHGRTIVQIQP